MFSKCFWNIRPRGQGISYPETQRYRPSNRTCKFPARFFFFVTVPDTETYQSSHKLASKTRSNSSRDINKGAGNYVNPARASEFKGRVQYSIRIQPDIQTPENCAAMRVQRAIARGTVKTGSQFSTLKGANNLGLAKGNQSEEYPDAPQAKRIG